MARKSRTKPVPPKPVITTVSEAVDMITNDLKIKPGHKRSKLSAEQIINRYNQYYSAYLFKGTMPWEYHETIERRYKQARARLIKHLMNI